MLRGRCEAVVVKGCAEVPVHGDGGYRANRDRCTLDQRPPIRGQRHVALYRNWETNPRVAGSFIVLEAAGCSEEQAIHGTVRHRRTGLPVTL